MQMVVKGLRPANACSRHWCWIRFAWGKLVSFPHQMLHSTAIERAGNNVTVPNRTIRAERPGQTDLPEMNPYGLGHRSNRSDDICRVPEARRSELRRRVRWQESVPSVGKNRIVGKAPVVPEAGRPTTRVRPTLPRPVESPGVRKQGEPGMKSKMARLLPNRPDKASASRPPALGRSGRRPIRHKPEAANAGRFF